MRLHQAGDLMGAIDAYQAALRIDPNRGDARSNLGAAYVRLGRFAEAIDQYQAALRVAPDELAIQFNLALAYYKAAQADDAVPLLERVVAAKPEARRVLLLADCSCRQGEEQTRHRRCSSRAPRSFPDNLAFGYLLGTALLADRRRSRPGLHGPHLQGRRVGRGAAADGHRAISDEGLSRRRRSSSRRPWSSTRSCRRRTRCTAGRCWRSATAERRARVPQALQVNPNDFDANLQLGACASAISERRRAGLLERAVDDAPEGPDRPQLLAEPRAADRRERRGRRAARAAGRRSAGRRRGPRQLATCYYRLKRKDDGDRESAIAERLNREIQEKQRQERQAAGGTTPAPTSTPRRRRGHAVTRRALWRFRRLRPRCWRCAPQPRRAGASAGRRQAPGASRRHRRGRPRPVRSDVRGCRRGATCRAVGRGDRALREGGEAPARLRRGLLVPGHAVLQARKFPEAATRSGASTRLCAEERRARSRSSVCASSASRTTRCAADLLKSRDLGVGDKDLCRRASYHAAVIMTRIEQYELALQTSAVRRGGERQPACDRGHGHGDAADADAAGGVPPDRREMVLMAGRGTYMRRRV